MPKTTGARYFAEMIKGYGITHAFFVPTILMDALAEMDELGVQKILTHGEKAAAYMADGYARAANRPGLCMGQQIGASNLAAGLRDAYMAGAPVIAITGGPGTPGRYRHSYQEVEDFAQFDSMTKLNMQLDDVSRLPDLMRQLFRAVTTGAPKPVHLRLRGSHGQGIECEADLPLPVIENEYRAVPAYRPEPEIERVKAALAQVALTGLEEGARLQRILDAGIVPDDGLHPAPQAQDERRNARIRSHHQHVLRPEPVAAIGNRIRHHDPAARSRKAADQSGISRSERTAGHSQKMGHSGHAGA